MPRSWCVSSSPFGSWPPGEGLHIWAMVSDDCLGRSLFPSGTTDVCLVWSWTFPGSPCDAHMCMCIGFLLISLNFVAYLWTAWFGGEKCVSQSQSYSWMCCSQNRKVCRERGLFLSCSLGTSVSSPVLWVTSMCCAEMKNMGCMGLWTGLSQKQVLQSSCVCIISGSGGGWLPCILSREGL